MPKRRDWKSIFANNPLDIEKDKSKQHWFRRLAIQENTTFEFVKKIYYDHHYKHKDINEHLALEEEAKEVGIPIKDVSHYWYKGEHFSIFTKNNHKTYFTVRDEIIESMKAHAPNYTNINYNYSVLQEAHLLVIDPADIHIGKLCQVLESGEEYNVEIAFNRVLEGLEGLLSKVSPFAIDEILLLIGNDILHVDNAKRTTTSGTPQDTDGMWYSNFIRAKQLYIKIIDRLIPLAKKLSIKHNPSNHDFTHGFFLADTIQSWYSKVDSIEFEVSIAHRKYLAYGKNLIGSTHGDGAKTAELPILMAQEASQHWHYCIHRYFYEHHIHHKRSKEYGSVTVESVRSPSGTDGWHHRNGYQHAAKAIEAFLHHKEHGQIAKFTHIFY